MNMSIHLTGWQVVGICSVCGFVILATLGILLALAPKPARPSATPLDDLMDEPQEQVGDDTLALFGNEADDINGDGSLVIGPGVKLSHSSIAAKARAAAHVELDDFLADPEGYTGADS